MLIVALCVLGIQLGSVTAAHADTDADLRISVSTSMANTAIQVSVCNYGPSDVTQFVLDVDTTNFDVYEARNAAFGSNSPRPENGGDRGTFDIGTMTWNGYLEYEAGDNDTYFERCIYIGFAGHSTGDVGTPVTITASIVSSELSDTSVNVDPVSENDSANAEPFTAHLDPDISVDTRLKTSGEITASSNVAFEVKLTNVGEGVYYDDGYAMLAFIIPDGATLNSVTDADGSDALSIIDGDPDADPGKVCASPGRVEDLVANLGMASLAGYSGLVVVCMFEISEEWVPGTSYKIDINITAGATFAAGTAEVVGFFEGNDQDTLGLQLLLIDESDIFAAGNNNIIHLAYDPESLQATSNRCPGQGETTSDGTGCFRITFNKKIYVESFDEGDIDLGGKGIISGFDQIDDYTWEIHVAQIPLNETVTFLLDLDGLIQDYSAVIITTQVLGVNTIRYEVASTQPGSTSGSTSATGTLSATGMHKPDFTTPALLIGLGIAMVAWSSRRKRHLCLFK